MTDPSSPHEHDSHEHSADEHSADQHLGGDDLPTGGDTTTQEQLTADNEVEEDTLKALHPGAPSA